MTPDVALTILKLELKKLKSEDIPKSILENNIEKIETINENTSKLKSEVHDYNNECRNIISE
jgi:uncharacterized protein (UPF0335 family)